MGLLNKCRFDIVGWAENFWPACCVLYPRQKQFLRNLETYDKNTLLGCRQCGKTMLCNMFVLYQTLFSGFCRTAMFFNTTSAAARNITEIRRALDSLPEFMKPAVVSNAKNRIEFKNGSLIETLAYSQYQQLRGQCLNTCVLDDMGSVENELADNVMSHVFPIVTRCNGRRLVATSSARRERGCDISRFNYLFYAPEWHGMEIMWYDVEFLRDRAEDMKSRMSPDAWATAFENEF